MRTVHCVPLQWGISVNEAQYWRAHLRLLSICLLVWFAVSYGCGILWADALNAWQPGGVPLGFWFAQQGSIYAFLLLIVIYNWRVARLQSRLDRSDRANQH